MWADARRGFEELVRQHVARVDSFRPEQSIPIRRVILEASKERAVVLVWEGTWILSALKSSERLAEAGVALSSPRAAVTQPEASQRLSEGDVLCGFSEFWSAMSPNAAPRRASEMASSVHVACRTASGGSLLTIPASAYVEHLRASPGQTRGILYLLRATSAAAIHLKMCLYSTTWHEQRVELSTSADGQVGNAASGRPKDEDPARQLDDELARAQSALRRLGIGRQPGGGGSALDEASSAPCESSPLPRSDGGDGIRSTSSPLPYRAGGSALLVSCGSFLEILPSVYSPGADIFVDATELGKNLPDGSCRPSQSHWEQRELAGHAGQVLCADALLIGSSSASERRIIAQSPSARGAWISPATLDALMASDLEVALELSRLLLRSVTFACERIGLGEVCAPRDAVEALASSSRCDLLRLAPGDVLFESGSASDGLHILLSGTLSVMSTPRPDCASVVVDTVNGGTRQVIGEISFISGAARTRTIEAETECELLFLPTALVWKLLERFPSRMKHLIFKSVMPRIKRAYLLSRLVPDGTVEEASHEPAAQVHDEARAIQSQRDGLMRRAAHVESPTSHAREAMSRAGSPRTTPRAPKRHGSSPRAVSPHSSSLRGSTSTRVRTSTGLRHSHAAPVAPFGFVVESSSRKRSNSTGRHRQLPSLSRRASLDESMAGTATVAMGVRPRPLRRLARLLRRARMLVGWSRAELLATLRRAMPWPSLAALEALVRAFHFRSLAPGACAFQVGEPCLGAYTLLRGALEFYSGSNAQQSSARRVAGAVCDIGALLFPGLSHLLCARASAPLASASSHAEPVLRPLTVVAMLGVGAYRRVVREHPGLELAFLRELVRTSLFTFTLLAHYELLTLDFGQQLFRKGERVDHLYLVCSGRIEVGTGSARTLKCKGEVVAMRSALVGSPAQEDAVATRTTELISIPVDAFSKLMEVDHAIFRQTLARLLDESTADAAAPETRSASSQCVMLLPAEASFGRFVPEFAQRLKQALSRCGRVLIVDRELVVDRFSVNIADRRELSHFLDQLEDCADFLLYVPDVAGSAWWAACVTHADVIFKIVGSRWRQHVALAPEKPLWTPRGSAQSTSLDAAAAGWTATDGHKPELLVVVHPDDHAPPIGTREALEAFQCTNHRHVIWNSRESFGMLARFVSGTSIGVALSGGGARGAAHIGLLQALLHSGTPIDYICGTSAGAFVGAAAAMHIGTRTQYKVERIARAHDGDLTGDGNLNTLRRLWIAQFKPAAFVGDVLGNCAGLSAGLISGDRTELALQQVYGSSRCIEDLWVPFFCNSVNLARPGEIHWHTSGPVWKALRASGSVPGLLPAVVSRTAQQTDVLIDGGLLNNMPADRLR